MKEKLLQFLHDENGLTSIEYAVAGALITVVLIGAFDFLGNQVAAVITIITAAISVI